MSIEFPTCLNQIKTWGKATPAPSSPHAGFWIGFLHLESFCSGQGTKRFSWTREKAYKHINMKLLYSAKPWTSRQREEAKNDIELEK